jgi:luciferase family oxidoreductase group 1
MVGVLLSVLDQSPVRSGLTATDAIQETLELAVAAERLGYHRYWLAEHHSSSGLAGSSPEVLIGQVAARTSRLRVGSAGIMLSHYSPLKTAEQFRTLEVLFPGRIDLGLGRAPGTDMATLRALRKHVSAAQNFPQDVVELRDLLGRAQEGQAIQAVPGAGTEVPLWILGSSLFGARLAAELGLPYAFASHFAPDALLPALELYRSRFRPSAQLAKPYAMIGANVIAADTDAEARRLFTTIQQAFTHILRDTRGHCPAPVEDIEDWWTPTEKAAAARMLECSVVGSRASVREGLERLAERTGADEIMAVAHIHDHAARVHSLETTAEAAGWVPG